MRLIFTPQFFLALMLAFLLCGAADAQTKTDREIAGLLGAVKTVSSRQTSYSGVEAKTEGQTRERDGVTYDKLGNEIERVVYDDYGTLIGNEIRKFSAAGNLTESILYDPQKALLEKQVFTYTGNKLTQIVTFDDKGAETLKQINTYDAKNRLTVETYYVAGKAFGKTLLKYDAAGNLSEAAFFLADETKAVAPVGPVAGAHREVYTYDAKKQVTGIVSYLPDGKQQRDLKYVYNAKGNITEDLTSSGTTRRKFVFTYEYDAGGNWIKQTGIQTDVSTSTTKSPDRKTVVTREIAYY
jgi:hypothetical protein